MYQTPSTGPIKYNDENNRQYCTPSLDSSSKVIIMLLYRESLKICFFTDRRKCEKDANQKGTESEH